MQTIWSILYVLVEIVLVPAVILESKEWVAGRLAGSSIWSIWSTDYRVGARSYQVSSPWSERFCRHVVEDRFDCAYH